MTAAIDIRGLTYSFGAHRAVDDLTLAVEPGECFGLLGPNGAGKTTTIRLLNTLLPLQSGEVEIFGRSVRTDALLVRRLLLCDRVALMHRGSLRALGHPTTSRRRRERERASRTSSATTPGRPWASTASTATSRPRREGCAVSERLVEPPAVWADRQGRTGPGLLASRVGTFCLVELQKLRHDRSELVTRAIQPILWLVIFGTTFTQIRAIPTGGIPYLDFLAPGVIAQSALFIAIFYGIQIIWERDAGVLTKLLVTPTPRSALVAGKAFAAGVRSVAQAGIVVLVAALMGVAMTWNPIRLLGVVVVVMLGAAFFSCLSLSIAGVALKRDRLMGIGQAITMPLFFASNALYPIEMMPGWLQVVSHVNPLTYEVSALRGLLLGTPTSHWVDFGVLVGSAVTGIVCAAALIGRLAR